MTALTLKEAISKGKLTFKDWLKDFSPERFEVSFSDIIKKRGVPEYLDSTSFFELTHLTPKMEDVLKWCLARVIGKDRKGVIHLATGFGGGKSHLLGLLYHVFTSRVSPDMQLLTELSLDTIPDVELIALDGHNLAYPISEKTELKGILRSTKDEVLSAIESRDRPLVILMDEFVVYLAKLEDERQREEMANLHTLISALNATTNCILVITNPEGAAAYAKEVETVKTTLRDFSDASSDISSILGRVTQPISPVEVEDFPSILRKRLVESFDAKVAKSVETHINKLTGLDCEGYYPFHPLLVDVLFSRISLFPDFQQTRDALKVVALGIKGLLSNSEHADFHLLSPADLLFSDADLKSILINPNVFGYNLGQAVTKDVIQSAKKADGGKVFERFSRIASAIFLYSLHREPEKRGITPADAHQCMPEIPSGKDMEQLLEKFYSEYSTFLWNERGRYLFKSDQNIPNLIRMKSTHISGPEVIQYIKETLYDTVFGSATTSQCVFHQEHPFSPKSKTLNVIIPFHWDDPEKIRDKHLPITSLKKNTIIIMVPNKGVSGPVEYYAKLSLAAEKVKKEVKETPKLFDEAKRAYKNNEATVLQQFRGMYTTLWYLKDDKETEVKFDPLPANITIREKLLTRLKTSQKLVDIENIDPKLYLTKLIGKRDSVQVRELLENVEGMTNIPFAYPSDLKEVIKKGVYESIVGVVKGVIPSPITVAVVISFGPAAVISEINDGDTVVSAIEAQRIKRDIASLIKDSTARGTDVTGTIDTSPDPTITPTPTSQEQVDTFVADMSDLSKQLSDRMLTILVVEDLAVRAELTFTGSIKGTLTAANLQELQAIQELAEGLKKAAPILGGVKASMTLYTREV